MSWIKRNLYFVIGASVAVLLMGLAGFYLYSQKQRYAEIGAKLDEDYGMIDNLNRENPHPGSGKINNIEIAKKQQAELRQFIGQVRQKFVAIPGIPEGPKVTSQDFTAALRRTIDELTKDANSASVTIPTNYNFSFEAQKPRVTFAAGSLDPLAQQLGHVKAISEILFNARINALDSIRRERVSSDDSSGPQTDYLDRKSTTNGLAVMVPYEVTFTSFSSELASALTGFATSPHPVLIKTINVEPAGSTNALATAEMTGLVPGAVPNAYAAMMARAYGRAFPGMMPGTTPSPATTPRPGGLQTVLDEKPLRVTLALEVVKLLPPPK